MNRPVRGASIILAKIIREGQWSQETIACMAECLARFHRMHSPDIEA